MSKDFLLPHNFLESYQKMTVPRKTIQTIRLCVRDTQSPAGNMNYQPEASIHNSSVAKNILSSISV